MIFDPVEKIPLASMFGKRPKDLPVNTMMDMELQADEKASMHILSMTDRVYSRARDFTDRDRCCSTHCWLYENNLPVLF